MRDSGRQESRGIEEGRRKESQVSTERVLKNMNVNAV